MSSLSCVLGSGPFQKKIVSFEWLQIVQSDNISVDCVNIFSSKMFRLFLMSVCLFLIGWTGGGGGGSPARTSPHPAPLLPPPCVNFKFVDTLQRSKYQGY